MIKWLSVGVFPLATWRGRCMSWRSGTHDHFHARLLPRTIAATLDHCHARSLPRTIATTHDRCHTRALPLPSPCRVRFRFTLAKSTTYEAAWNCHTTVERTRQSRSDAGLAFQVKVLDTFEVVHSWLEGGQTLSCSNSPLSVSTCTSTSSQSRFSFPPEAAT